MKPFTIATDDLKYLSITLTNLLKDMSTKNFNSLKKKLKKTSEDGKMCSWMDRINMVKIATLPKPSSHQVHFPPKFQHNYLQNEKQQFLASYQKQKMQDDYI